MKPLTFSLSKKGEPSLIYASDTPRTTSYSLNRVGTNAVGKVAELHSVLKSLLELILVLRVLDTHHLLHPLSCNLEVRISKDQDVQSNDQTFL